MKELGQATQTIRLVTDTVHVTPEIAGDWLQKNLINRPLRDEWVKELARRIAAGEWNLDGQAIKFDVAGNLADGQHRLLAVIMADQAIDTLVVWHIPEDAYETLDGSAQRTLADALGRKGEASRRVLAATINLHWRYEHKTMVGRIVLPSIKSAMAHLEDHPGLRQAVLVGERTANKARARASVLATAWYLFSQIDEDIATSFMATLASGADLNTTDPIYRLRERFIGNRHARLKLSGPELLALTIKAWNLWRVGQEVQVLSWRFRGGELFPEAR